ncbi:hypothetical protein FB446DRAFT_792740 [Lentinula raphanica]|nr:hypothetical protein FB446DRAFT_792740 [Lentinula raphanica]
MGYPSSGMAHMGYPLSYLGCPTPNWAVPQQGWSTRDVPQLDCSTWDVPQQGCPSYMGCPSAGMSLNRDVPQLGCPSTGMSLNWDVLAGKNTRRIPSSSSDLSHLITDDDELIFFVVVRRPSPSPFDIFRTPEDNVQQPSTNDDDEPCFSPSTEDVQHPPTNDDDEHSCFVLFPHLHQHSFDSYRTPRLPPTSTMMNKASSFSSLTFTIPKRTSKRELELFISLISTTSTV